MTEATEAAEHALTLLNEAWDAVPKQYQHAAKVTEPTNPLPEAIRLMAYNLAVGEGGTG